MHQREFADEEHEARMRRIVREYGDSILRLCLIYLHDYHLAQDAAQDSFVKIHRKLDTFHADRSEKAWIMRIVSNTCKDYCRSFWFKHIDRKAVLDDMELPADEANSDADEVIAAVSALPRAEREVILLRYYQNMKISEVAQALHLSVSAVNKRLKKAQEMLRPALWEVYFNE